MTKLADHLSLDVPLPADPFSALVAVRARKARLAEKVATIMVAAFPDFERVIDTLEAQEEAAVRRIGATMNGGEA